MELDKIMIKYGADLSDLKNDFSDLKKQTVGFEKQAADSSKKVEDSLNKVGDNVSGKLSSAFSSLGRVVAAAFAVERIGAFINSSIELATKTQEIKAEFDKLNNPKLLANLKKSTEGTLSDLKLMEIALRADKLGVPMDKLGKIMEFAKLRADALGKSTEELADTLIQGIGIKGTRALVQVGISQEQFSAEVTKTGDYFTALDNIMTTTLASAGQSIDSVADKQDRLNASIENSKAAIGNAFLPVIDNILSGITKVITGWQMLADGTTAAEKQAYDVTVDYLTKKTTSWIDYQQLLLKTQKNIFDAEKAIAEGSEKDRLAAKESLPIYEMRLKALQDYNMEYFKTKGVVKETTAAVVENTQATDKQVKTFGDLDEQTEVLLKTTGAVNETYVDLTLLMAQAQEQMAAGDEVAYNATLSKMADILLDITGEKFPALKEALNTTDVELSKSTASWEDYAQALLSIFDSINTAYTQASDYRLGILQKELEQGTISEEEYDKKKKEILRGEAVREKAFSILSITLSTARAIMAALATVPPNPALAILAGLTGGIQLGVAAAAPIPAFEKGGKVKGGEQLVRINERGEEYVIRAEMTRKHQPLLEAINKDKFNEYIQKTTIKETKGNDVISWDDYRLLLELKKGNYTSRENTQRIVEAIKSQRQPHRFQ